LPVFESIGIFRCGANFKFEAPRQGIFQSHLCGQIDLNAGQNLEQALRDLEGFDRIWVLYQFDRNQHWRPTTRPPIPPKGKDRVGVFASRSPYRPNPIGMSAVRLLGIEGLHVLVAEADLLDGTPILDIKPYIPAFDSFPDSKAGWLEDQLKDRWTVHASPEFAQQNLFVQTHANHDLDGFAQVQLSHNPFDHTRKRVVFDETTGIGMIAFRTWRICFSRDLQQQTLTLIEIQSGYTKMDLATDAPDPYSDKECHRNFNRVYFPG
jgi:tRNA-Thr(GGU) m(6)t(6)A37 methyltransferase TsaA